MSAWCGLGSRVSRPDEKGNATSPLKEKGQRCAKSGWNEHGVIGHIKLSGPQVCGQAFDNWGQLT